MVNKCSCRGCFTNFPGHDQGSVFKLPKEETLRNQWIKFINRKNEDIKSMKYVFVCEKHFKEKYLNKNRDRPRLKTNLNPIPTMLSGSQKNLPKSVLPSISVPRKPPVQRNAQEDQSKHFMDIDRILDFSQINESLLLALGSDFHFRKYEDNAVFFALQSDYLSVPRVTHCIRVDSDLHVKLFYEGSPVPLPRWFCYSRNAKLTAKSMLENFPSYMKSHYDKHGTVLEELGKLKFIRNHVYSANLLRYALMLRYSSLPSYKLLLREFNLPSISFLRKLVSGKLDSEASVKLLKDNGAISEDVILMFDEIYLQKCEEYSGGETIGADEMGELYKGLMCFMIVGLKSNVPFVVRSVPEKEISGDWLKEQIEKCIKELHDCSFNVRGIVCDNHSTNVSAYKKLHTVFGMTDDIDQLFITINGKKIYLFFDAVHLIKNIRNNLLNRKRLLFPEFFFDKFRDEIKLTGGEISWRLLHQVYEKDLCLDAHLRAAPKISSNVLHPGNNKQSVPLALAIFDPTTTAAIRSYFPDKEDAAGFLNLINVWWTISNAKGKVNTNNRIGNAAVFGDHKPEFLRALSQWLKQWDEAKIANCEKFTLSKQTSEALQKTLLCHAALIEDLLSDGFEYVLTSRFQSDPLERRYGQYRQMSGGRFLVSLMNIQTSEKILKIKTLVQEGMSINESVKINSSHDIDVQEMLEKFDDTIINASASIELNQDSKQISDYIAGYITVKIKNHYCDTCNKHWLLEHDGLKNESSSSYVSTLSRGGLTYASSNFCEYVALSFAYLDASSSIIRSSKVPSRKAGEEILKKLHFRPQLFCEDHRIENSARVDRVITNIFFNNQRKRLTESVVKDRVVAFKKIKRTRE